MQSLSISAQNKLIQKEKMRFFYKQLLYFKVLFFKFIITLSVWQVSQALKINKQ